MRTGDPTDHNFSGELQFIFAHGQNSDPFFAEGELKYHGGNRWKAVEGN